MGTTPSLTLAELTMTQASAANRHGEQEARVLAFVSRWFGGVFAGLIDKQAQKLASKALIFRGAIAQLEADPTSFPEFSDAEKEQALLQKMLEAEQSLLNVRKIALDSAKRLEELDGRRRGTVRDAWRRTATASADCLENMQAFKWALTERNADADVAAGRVQTFDNVEDLLGSLGR